MATVSLPSARPALSGALAFAALLSAAAAYLLPLAFATLPAVAIGCALYAVGRMAYWFGCAAAVWCVAVLACALVCVRLLSSHRAPTLSPAAVSAALLPSAPVPERIPAAGPATPAGVPSPAPLPVPAGTDPLAIATRQTYDAVGRIESRLARHVERDYADRSALDVCRTWGMPFRHPGQWDAEMAAGLIVLGPPPVDEAPAAEPRTSAADVVRVLESHAEVSEDGTVSLPLAALDQLRAMAEPQSAPSGQTCALCGETVADVIAVHTCPAPVAPLAADSIPLAPAKCSCVNPKCPIHEGEAHCPYDASAADQSSAVCPLCSEHAPSAIQDAAPAVPVSSPDLSGLEVCRVRQGACGGRQGGKQRKDWRPATLADVTSGATLYRRVGGKRVAV